jgi:aspartate racemase
MFLLARLLPNRAVYNVPCALEWKGTLDLESLRRALNTIIARHEPLRTTFQPGEECDVQVIAAQATVTIQTTSLRHVPAAERDRETRRVLEEEARRPFDLGKDVMLRALVVELADHEHILLLTFHHIAIDGWSLDVFLRELGQLYKAYVNRRSNPELPELPIRYRDYSLWQREWLQGDVLQRELSYWKKQLDGVEVLELPTDRPRPMERSYQGAWERVILPSALSERLQAFSRAEGVSLFTLLLAVFMTLLYRYSGQDDICVGSPVANRTRRETEDLIGLFVNTLVMRTDFRGQPRFRELLERVKDTVWEAQAHQELPFERLVHELHPDRSGNRSPLFQVMFVLNNTLKSGLAVPEITAIRGMGTGTAKFDLTLSADDRPGGIETTLEYSTDLFDSATAKRMLGHYRVLLEAVVADPDQQVSHMPILDETERRQLLLEWNNTKQEYPQLCVHQLFEKQAGRTPDAIAVVYNNKRVSYGELNRRANQIAHHLISLGVGPEVRVGICLQRSVDMVATLLGILKAGAVYVPLDADYPPNRLRFIERDAELSVVVTDIACARLLPELTASLVCVDTLTRLLDRNSNPVCRTQPTNPAYVTYTSGSTGTPKGVEVLHRGIVRLICGADYARMDPADVFLQLAPISFDASTFELWGALLSGARCILFPGKVATAVELGRVLAKERVTILWLTATYFNLLLDEAPEIFKTVKQLVVGGEVLSVAHIHRALALLPDTQIINGYGPTESTTFTCTYHIERNLKADVTSISIGKPIANTKVYVLDGHLEPVPIGVPGELYIGGDGLARGYLNRPDLTAERFIPSPFSTDSDSRLYRTGDIVRYLPDGNLEFLGRLDHQVKIRGHRVELGEIEAALSAHPAVRAAVANCTGDQACKEVIAWVVPSPGQKPATTELQSFLKQNLPDWMVPGRMFCVTSLPLTPSGKVDRTALVAPARANRAEPQLPPIADSVELQLAAILQVVLGVRVGPDQDFFDLGGTSLMAVQVATKIRKTFGVDLPVATLFRAPTLGELTAVIRAGGRCSAKDCLVPLRPEGSNPPLFLVHPAGGDALCYAGLALHLGSDQPVYALQEGALAGNGIEEMASRYLREIRSIQPQGPYYLGGHCSGGVVAFEMAQRLMVEGQRVDFLALLDSYPPGLGQLWSNFSLARSWSKFGRSRSKCVARMRHHADSLRRGGWRSNLTYLGEHLNLAYLRERLGCVYSRWGARSQIRALLRPARAAMASYRPQTYLGTAVLFNVADHGEGAYCDPTESWRRLVKGKLIVRSVPGCHGTMLLEPNVATLAAELRAAIDETLAGRSPVSRVLPQLDVMARRG